MPRQKFCSVPGCLSTTDSVKREQESFLAAYCERCSSPRPCRCSAPDIYTTRRETRTKFNSWCSAIGLKDPGYYINVCHKHFSAGCPSRTCPDPDVVTPVWEKHVQRDKAAKNSETEVGGPTPANAAVASAVAAPPKTSPRPAAGTAAPFPCRKMARPSPPSAVAATTSPKGKAPDPGRRRGSVARAPLNNNSLKMRPTLKRSMVIEQRTPRSLPPHPPPAAAPFTCRSSSTGSNSSACSSASSSPVSSGQPPLPVSSPPPKPLTQPKLPMARTMQPVATTTAPVFDSAGDAAATALPAPSSGPTAEQPRLQRPPPDIPALLSSIVQRQNRLHNAAGSPPQCFLTLNPPSPPPAAAVREASVVRLGGRAVAPSSPAPVSLPPTLQQQPDLRKLQPLPLSSIRIEIEPDLKKLTPVPISEKELSDAPARPLLPILVTNFVKDAPQPPLVAPAPQAHMDSSFAPGLSSTDASLPLSIPITLAATTGMEIQEDLSYDGPAMASLMKEDAANDEEIRLVLLDEGNGLLDQSEDPCLNDGNRVGSNFASRGLADSPFGDESVQKWLEICEA